MAPREKGGGERQAMFKTNYTLLLASRADPPQDDQQDCQLNLLHQNLNPNQGKQQRRNLEQRPAKVLKGRRMKSKKLQRKAQKTESVGDKSE
ncbi:hypothetical protein HGM15179_002427 [Zosterops borbonicus]|uniref:Uncharacterized protein n=1 Tax=Zosterops borbonicus TaxID=364589 RepID=A0A8K1LS29_9PASS|nr:hypothetical protein HGM15179_002427 [Zosterops borbonicus]